MNTETAGVQGAPGEAPQGETQGETSDGVQYGGFWLRLAAFVADFVILIVISAIVGLVFPVPEPFFSLNISGLGEGVALAFPFPAPAGTEISGMAAGVNNLIHFAVVVVYFTGFNSSKMQATPGKRILGLKVTDAAGSRLSVPRALGRYFASIVSSLILGIGYIMIAFTNRKRGLHDMMAGTLVVKR